VLTSIRKRLARDDEQGFTLIELMVVVLIIAILIAIAIPTFLGARERSQDRAAQSDLRNGLTAEKTIYTDTEAYTDVVANLEAVEPSLGWQQGALTDSGQVRVQLDAANDNVVCLSAQSAGGDDFAIADIATGASAGTYYFGDGEYNGTCTAANAATGDPEEF
jgi:type IV pilus assembly protein PilA